MNKMTSHEGRKHDTLHPTPSGFAFIRTHKATRSTGFKVLLLTLQRPSKNRRVASRPQLVHASNRSLFNTHVQCRVNNELLQFFFANLSQTLLRPMLTQRTKNCIIPSLQSIRSHRSPIHVTNRFG
jgi:hypothetical protein